MFLYHSRVMFYHICIQFIVIIFLNTCLGAEFDAKTKFAWVDSSCDSVIDKVNDAGDQYNALVNAAIANLEGGSPSTDLGKATLDSFFGTPVGQLINSKYGRLKSAFAAQPIALSLYCDGTAFEWVTTYQEGEKKGQDLPGGGQWHAKAGRSNPAEGALYLSGTKTPERTNICLTPAGQNAQGVSAVGGKHIILCPDAFKDPLLGAVPTTEQTIGTSLDTLTSTGAVLLHEASHCILSTIDTPLGYKINGVLFTAKISSAAQKNADTWMYYAMASIASKNAWVVGLAQALDNFGPKAPKAPPSTRKRDTLPLDNREPRAEPDDAATDLHGPPGSPMLKARAADAVTVTVTVTVTKDCPGGTTGHTGTRTKDHKSTGKGTTGAGHTGTGTKDHKSTGKGTTGAGHTGTGTKDHKSTGKGTTGAGHTGTGTKGHSSTGKEATGAGHTGTGTKGRNSKTESGFKTSKSKSRSNSASTGKGGYIGPVPISAQPASITAALVSESSVNVIGLTTFSGTKTPSPVVISSSVSSNGHSKQTNGVGPFPIFWSHTCWFCPPGLCLSCGIQLDLPKGIYPPGSIKPPPGWTGPLPTITIGNDGTPSYDEEEPKETKDQPSKTKEQPSKTKEQSSKTKNSKSSSASKTSSATSGGGYIFETPAIYSEVSEPVPFVSVSAVVAADFARDGIDGYGGGSGTTGTGSGSTRKSKPASTTFSSSKHGKTTPTTTPKPSSTIPLKSATPPAFSCSSQKNPQYADYPCICQAPENLHYCTKSGGGCGWTTVPAAEDCCLDCE